MQSFSRAAGVNYWRRVTAFSETEQTGADREREYVSTTMESVDDLRYARNLPLSAACSRRGHRRSRGLEFLLEQQLESARSVTETQLRTSMSPAKGPPDGDRSAGAGRITSPTVDDRTRPRKFLFVDDNFAFAENMAEIVELAGYGATCAASAEEAIGVVARGDICAIVTDFRLPGLDGIDLVETIRRSGCGIPVAILTAYASESVIERARRLGIDHVLSKPIDPQHVVRLVSEFSGSG